MVFVGAYGGIPGFSHVLVIRQGFLILRMSIQIQEDVTDGKTVLINLSHYIIHGLTAHLPIINGLSRDGNTVPMKSPLFRGYVHSHCCQGT